MNYWQISGYNSLTRFVELKIPQNDITDRQLANLLKTLTAKHSLTDEEIASCYHKKNAKKYQKHLYVQLSGTVRPSDQLAMWP